MRHLYLHNWSCALEICIWSNHPVLLYSEGLIKQTLLTTLADNELHLNSTDCINSISIDGKKSVISVQMCMPAPWTPKVSQANHSCSQGICWRMGSQTCNCCSHEKWRCVAPTQLCQTDGKQWGMPTFLNSRVLYYFFSSFDLLICSGSLHYKLELFNSCLLNGFSSKYV